ncbi:anti-sigma factor antagonist [Bacillus sp. Marseille-P3661]|uniref:anti-sigma factor antagonist n=1 Tax=Bacillus sp. Marseille-P3661 TaxID=1936234 RepID=UPI000C82678C|nr:anti-sigma factor antagonist [Bacillus sp. Marseille-P3661]
MNLKIDNKKIGNDQVLSIVGEVDAYTAPKLREVLIPLTEQEEMNVVVHLSGVRYMDSTGLGVFIGALKSCRRHGCSLKLVGLTERVERLFQITGLSEIIDIETADIRGEM